MSVRLGQGITQATCEDTDGRGGLSIALTQPQGSVSRWRFRVRAQTDEGLYHVGTFTTCPPVLTGPPTQPQMPLSRVVAIANCPGAVFWTVDVTVVPALLGPVDPATIDKGAEVSIAAGWPAGEAVGVKRVGERYKYLAGVSGIVPINAGEVVLGWGARSAGGGIARIDPLTGPPSPAIQIPAGTAVSGDPRGLLEGPLLFHFVDTDAYFIEVAESA